MIESNFPHPIHSTSLSLSLRKCVASPFLSYYFIRFRFSPFALLSFFFLFFFFFLFLSLSPSVSFYLIFRPWMIRIRIFWRASLLRNSMLSQPHWKWCYKIGSSRLTLPPIDFVQKIFIFLRSTGIEVLHSKLLPSSLYTAYSYVYGNIVYGLYMMHLHMCTLLAHTYIVSMIVNA